MTADTIETSGTHSSASLLSQYKKELDSLKEEERAILSKIETATSEGRQQFEYERAVIQEDILDAYEAIRQLAPK
ncbi:MAG: hypothetical protein RSC82_07025, partial [Oscillospiraceae bacterium]